jgi:uncharacterized membrane protein HdeD (DUF308 family)
MSSHPRDGFLSALVARWWIWVVRGIAALLFGVLAFAAPASSLVTLVTLWGAYALVDGVFALGVAAQRGRAGLPWGWMVFEGLVGIVAGVTTFVWPAITAIVLLAVIAVRSVLAGIAQIAAAIALRREITDEWLLGASGVMSIAFGLLLLARPAVGALAVVWIIGGYAMVFGALLIAFGLRLNGWRRSLDHHEPHGAQNA